MDNLHVRLNFNVSKEKGMKQQNFRLKNGNNSRI
jgi:hypothetical protein